MITPETDEQKIAKTFVQNNTDAFERMVLARVIHDKDFFDRVRGILCRENDSFVNQFESVQMYALYRALYLILPRTPEGQVPPTELLRVFLDSLAADGTVISMSAVPEVMALYLDI
jgi:hypothetical protein